MNKTEFVNIVAEKLELSNKQSNDVIGKIFTTIAELLSKKDKIVINGFGSFTSKVRNERKGRNPKTGEDILIPSAVVVNFKPAEQLKNMVNAIVAD